MIASFVSCSLALILSIGSALLDEYCAVFGAVIGGRAHYSIEDVPRLELCPP
jgi:hypothetical protein